jgi:HD-GYP domain-containing protein (c-di-GMP phosphodiesterase class II)
MSALDPRHAGESAPHASEHAARSDEDVILESLAPSLVMRLSALIRTARTHDVANQAFQRQLQDFAAVLTQMLENEDEVVLVAVAEYLYLNGHRIKANSALLPVVHGLIAEFERRGLGGLRFLQGVDPAELERFFQLFLAAEDAGISEHLGNALEEARIEHVTPVPASELDADDLTRDLGAQEQGTERGRAKRVFWRAVLGTRKVLLRARQNGRPDLRQAKRLVQPVVDNFMRHEFSLVGMTAIKDHDEYTYAHCVNVSILSVGIGQALGLPRQVLADLGVAGLLHDIGKVAVPGDVLQPAALTRDEWGWCSAIRSRA